jgi:hypothetical protein
MRTEELARLLICGRPLHVAVVAASVVAAFASLLSAQQHVGGRYYSDPQRRMTMVVEIGVDNIIESVSIELGQHGPTKGPAAPPISRRLDAGEGFGVFHKLKLGSSEGDVRANLGEPNETLNGSNGVTWVYQTDYVNTECHSDAEIRVVLANGHVTRVVFYNGE